MRKTLSGKQLAICGVIAVAVGLLYLYVCLYAINGAWQRNEGDLPPVKPWIEDFSIAIVVYPFALTGIDNMLVVPILNGLFWSVVAGIGCVWILRRRNRGPGG